MTFLERFDRWAVTSPVSSTDLGIYRVVFGITTLLSAPDVRWIAGMPADAFSTPYGPLRMISSVPPLWALVGLQLILTIALITLTLGVAISSSSAVVAVALLLINGLNYSFGKIDHTVLWAIVPAIFLFSRWGRGTAGWPPRLLAVAIGTSFAWSGISKVLSGWLDPATHTAVGYMLQAHAHNGDPLGPVLTAAAASPWAEALDWFVVLIEVGMIVTVISWRVFRASLVILSLFHLSILLLLGIAFGWNLIAYGAFVAWSGLRKPKWFRAPKTTGVTAAVVCVIGLGSFFWSSTDVVRSCTNVALVVTAATLAIAYLAHTLFGEHSALRRAVSPLQ